MTVQVCTGSNVSNICNRMFAMEFLFKLPLFCQHLKKRKNFYLYKGKVNDCLKTCESLLDTLEKGKKKLFLLVFVQGESHRNFLIPFYIVCLQKVCSSQHFKVF